MPRRFVIFLLVSLSLILTGCKLKEVGGALASAAKNAVTDAEKNHGTTASTTTATQSTAVGAYTPPADGRLTGTQIENYIKIRQRAKQYEEAGRHQMEQQIKDGEGKSPGIADLVGVSGAMQNVIGGEEKAAKELGYNTDEYEWVRLQMIEASQAAISDKGMVAAQKIFAKQQTDLQRSIDTAPDESSREIYRAEMAENDKKLKKDLAAVEPHPPAVIYNAQLLAKYEDVGRPMYEAIFKGTGHEAEITKALKALNDPLAQP